MDMCSAIVTMVFIFIVMHVNCIYAYPLLVTTDNMHQHVLYVLQNIKHGCYAAHSGHFIATKPEKLLYNLSTGVNMLTCSNILPQDPP